MTLPLEHIQVPANGLVFNVAVAGRGDRLALLLHGAPELSYSWRHQMSFLAGLGYRVWAPDLRGYGGTERPAERDGYPVEALLADVAGLIDAARASQVTLVGHDWGGIIAWWFAIRSVRPLERLVILNAPHPAVAGHAFRRSPRQWLRSWYIVFFQLPRLPEWWLARRVNQVMTSGVLDRTSLTDADVSVFRAAVRRPGAAKAVVDYYRAYFAGGGLRRQLRLGVERIGVPTLLIWGEADTALGPELIPGTEEYVDDLTVIRLPGVSHWVQQEAPDKVNSALAGWLTSTRSAHFHEDD